MGAGEAPGWDAIDAAMSALYGDQAPRHVGYYPPMGLSDNLQGCSAYAADGHWHYVTYGLSELYRPHAEDDPGISGWGFELTLRVARTAGSEAPGHPHVDGAPWTDQTVFAFTRDPELGGIQTPFGRVLFLQAFGVTPQEKQRMVESSTADVLALLAEGNPLLVTDPARAST